MTTDQRGESPPKETADLRTDIERTREELGETVEELARKADIKGRARERAAELKARVRDSAQRTKERVSSAAAQRHATGEKVPVRVRRRAVQAADVVRRHPVAFASGGAVAIAGTIALRGRSKRGARRGR